LEGSITSRVKRGVWKSVCAIAYLLEMANERKRRVAGDEQIIYWWVANLVPDALGRS